ncbi:cytochrome-c peroxidase [Aquirufa novilacunae]|jgi:cytochrome c peroxidase|uniref:Cytochrome c peroxidase n=1 Tax=Aquirufa novilacunae TaxID=3139305 RepID=A0ABW8U3U9_9BACT
MRYYSLLLSLLLFSCKDALDTAVTADPYTEIKKALSIDPAALENYAAQGKPTYVNKDNTAANPITDKVATLGRVLFYDKNLSVNNGFSCASCHKQEFAFGDTAVSSLGVDNGRTIRHSMRLINSRFANEAKFFWNERAASLEAQTTMPIQDHLELGFSGQTGRGNMTSLITKLGGIGYYKELFKLAYGDATITEARMQTALAQFIRSIQSFDSKYDVGRAQVPNDGAPFPNFTAQENAGKNLFLAPPIFNGNSERIGGGFGCQGCHQAPEFDIDPNSRNNGFIGVIGSTQIDLDNTRSPSLRDILNASGVANTPFMHTAASQTIRQVLNHYNTIAAGPRNTNLDARLKPNNIGQNLQMTPAEIDAMVAFLRTLTGKDVYTNKKWGNPFL